jgi:hypothetical protein
MSARTCRKSPKPVLDAEHCPHGYKPIGWWQGPGIGQTQRTYQVALSCCMWYPVVANEAAAASAFTEFLKTAK